MRQRIRVLGGVVLLGVACAAWGFLPDEPKPVPKAVPRAAPKPIPKAAPKAPEAAAEAPAVPVAPPAKAAAERRPGKVFRDCADCPEMVVIPGGSFDMGGTSGDESPVHRVSVRSFAMGKTEVTQEQWRAVMGNSPSRFSNCGADCPVEKVSWNDAQDYVRKLSANTGKTYRLPSEAEWEYACRAGGRHEYCGGDNLDAVGWYGAYATPKGNSRESTNPVARKQANAFGLYDMSGNVLEWTEDCWHANYSGAPGDGSAWTSGECSVGRVRRGGSWGDSPQNARSANRFRDVASFRYLNYGFRLARMLP